MSRSWSVTDVTCCSASCCSCESCDMSVGGADISSYLKRVLALLLPQCQGGRISGLWGTRTMSCLAPCLSPIHDSSWPQRKAASIAWPHRPINSKSISVSLYLEIETCSDSNLSALHQSDILCGQGLVHWQLRGFGLSLRTARNFPEPTTGFTLTVCCSCIPSHIGLGSCLCSVSST